MLKHAGMLEPQPSMIPAFDGTTTTELQWRSWLHRESRNRYTKLLVPNDSGKLTIV